MQVKSFYPLSFNDRLAELTKSIEAAQIYDKSALIVKDVEISKDNVDQSSIHTYVSTFTLTMKNGQINLDGKLVGLKDVTQTDKPMDVHCVFTKKQ